MGMLPVTITAELLINGAFTDISGYIYQRDGIHVTGGAVNWGDTPQPATCTFTVNNRDGRFTPNNASGAYYPYLQRNVQVRFTVTATSSSGNFYSGYRFWGQVSEWPPQSDPAGTDIYVQVTASGPLRMVNAGGGQGSALTRYYASLTGSYAPQAYWPAEEDPSNSGIIGAGISGGQNMTVTTGRPSWKAISDFNGSAPVGVLNNSTWDGLTGSYAASGDDIFTVPGTYQWVAPVSSAAVRCWGPAGKAGQGILGIGTGTGGGAGAGGTAFNAAVPFTVGNSYPVVVTAGASGLDTTVTGDSGTVVAGHPGGNASGGTHGTGAPAGTGGFAGGSGADGGSGFSGGGGSSAGTSGAGNSAAGQTGGAAVTGGGAGATGRTTVGAGAMGGSPGGAGAGGVGGSGGNGAPGGGGAGKAELVYTPPSAPSCNILRFILLVPKHGGNNNRVLVRALTGGTIHQLDVLYQTGGKILLKGYNNVASLLFTSSSITVGDGQTLFVSAELFNSGSSVAWFLKAMVPGAVNLTASTSGTQATASCGNVTEVIVAPNADITKTAVGHISVQYAIIDIRKVSRALNGHDTELSIDRFIRLANENALDQEPQFTEASDHWGFEAGTQAWAGTNATVSQSTVTLSGVAPWSWVPAGTPGNGSVFTVATAQAAFISPGHLCVSAKNPGVLFTVKSIGPPGFGFNDVSVLPMAKVLMDATDTVTQVVSRLPPGASPDLTPAWPTEGAHSLLITSAGGAGNWQAQSPGGTSGQPVLPGDLVSAAADVYTPAALGALSLGVWWYNAAGTNIANTNPPGVATAAGDVTTLHLINAVAPATAAFFAVFVQDSETVAAGKLLYVDHVRVSPRMGVQTRKEYAAFLREIKALDQGILKESKILFGLGYRTRLALISRPAAVTLDYSAGTLSPPLAPVIDDHLTATQVTVKRARGSKVTTAHAPQPGGPLRSTKVYAAQADAQLAALAAHLLNLGTNLSERYPTVTVQLARASIGGHALAPLMSAVAGVEEGDRIVLSNLPFWMPSATASQLVIGYDEVINAFEWTITWNCVPESPWQVSAANLRRW